MLIFINKQNVGKKFLQTVNSQHSQREDAYLRGRGGANFYLICLILYEGHLLKGGAYSKGSLIQEFTATT